MSVIAFSKWVSLTNSRPSQKRCPKVDNHYCSRRRSRLRWN